MTRPAPGLPPDRVADNDEGLFCPWCGSAAELVQVSLEDLLNAHVAHALARPHRTCDGAPDPLGLVATCDACLKPFLVALQDAPHRATSGRTRRMRLLAVRTPADLALIHGPSP